MREWTTVKEAAEKIGVTEAYVREILNRAQCDKSIKLKGTKVGKEWKVSYKSINDFLGINIDEESYKKDLYIKELEGKVKAYEIKIQAFETLATSLQGLIGGGI